MRNRSVFECINGCGSHDLFQVIYRCPTCDGLLEVRHDHLPLVRTPAARWRERFERRVHSNKWPYYSGVWRYRELVLPAVPDESIVSVAEGNTNLFWAEQFGNAIGVPDLWVKLCGNSHTGSFKDLGMTVLVSMVKAMRQRGIPIRAVGCASTGDTSAALAAYAAAAGIPAVVLLPQGKISLAQLLQPLANGAVVLALDTDFDGCMKTVQQFVEKEGVYLANSMNSLRIEGQQTVAMETIQQFDWEVPDWIAIPVGNAGNVSALGKGLEMLLTLGIISKRPRILAVQAANANPLYQSYRTGFNEFKPVAAQATLASAIQIGNPVSIDKAVRALKAFDGVVEEATEQEIADMGALADRSGLFTCPHTAVAMTGVRKLAERGIIEPHHRVVVISTAHGLKFTDSKLAYHLGQLQSVESRYTNRPIEVANSLDAVRREFDRAMTARERRRA